MLDPRRVLRWVWLGRIVLACAILVAAVFVWNRADPTDTLVATLAFAVAVLATVASAMYGEVQRRSYGPIFYGLQCAVDLALVTAVVHITGGWSSQFAALYILVIAALLSACAPQSAPINTEYINYFIITKYFFWRTTAFDGFIINKCNTISIF